MPERNTTIAGLSVKLNTPYEEGHAINPAEAAVLNQTFAENIGNNLRKRIAELRSEDGTFSDKAAKEAQKLVDEAAKNYEFSLTPQRGSGSRLDPLEREIMRVASDLLVAKIKSDKGMTKKAYIEAIDAAEGEGKGQEKFDSLVSQIMQDDGVIAAGKKAYEEKQKKAAEKEKLANAINI